MKKIKPDMSNNSKNNQILTGFTLGKYAPFHNGHLYVLSTALEEMDHVIVVVYNASETTNVPTALRAQWIRETVPEVEVLVADEGPQVSGYTADIIKTQNDFLIDFLRGKKIDAFYSSEPYGQSVSAAFCCKNRIVDMARSTYPLSATEIRETPNLLKKSVPPVVFSALKPKLYFLGAPSTGKTTLSQLCAEQFHGAHCEEYGREYWFKFQKNHRLTMEDLEAIARGHSSKENLACKADVPMTFIDTSTLTTVAYAYYYFGYASKKLKQELEDNLWKHSHVFLCNDDIPFEQTWDRSGPQSRGHLQKINIRLLNEYEIKYTLVSGSIRKRVVIIQKYLEKNNIWQDS